jgi:hypothetical protein
VFEVAHRFDKPIGVRARLASLTEQALDDALFVQPGAHMRRRASDPHTAKSGRATTRAEGGPTVNGSGSGRRQAVPAEMDPRFVSGTAIMLCSWRPSPRRHRLTISRGASATSNTARSTPSVAWNSGVTRQLPGHRPGIRPGRRVLVRVDGAGATHAYLDWLTAQRLAYSVGS